ncbi:hypothetical protein BBR47_14450 [Brevibacillus brevis NBRC 100599]|uniref:Uncharacterized protein n=1 Tax=Brevibacillus brevis (strain 47 / JCM 6285 / NBRC 100599) TaxID=358681 RepID=C0Z8V2_BREBN|nr:hypothetical protein BBR47_14450 [Brevibacillus brevis NBRC 100599]
MNAFIISQSCMTQKNTPRWRVSFRFGGKDAISLYVFQ